MAENRDLILGGRTFSVPPLPLGVTRKIYPLCRKLALPGALVERVLTEKLLINSMTDEDLADLMDINFPCAQVADPDFTREQFEAMPITPSQLFDGFFFVARYQTGMWVPAAPGAEQPEGEVQGEASPQTSISTESSPA